MSESAIAIDLNPNRTVGLELPIASSNTSDFAVTNTSSEQSEYNIQNLLLTFPGERVGQPEFGSRLRAICFEPIDSDLPEKVESEIRDAVSIWLPYINIINVSTLTEDGDKNKIVVRITYSTALDSQPMSTDVQMRDTTLTGI